MIQFEQKGNFDKTVKFLGILYKRDFLKRLDSYGREGVEALSAATPVDSGNTKSKWYYQIQKTLNSVSIIWRNSNVVDGVPVVILLQYGHGTRNGGYVSGTDFINPAVAPLFDKMADEIWREVTNS